MSETLIAPSRVLLHAHDYSPMTSLVVVTNMLYAQITTRAKATSVAGVCHGFFYYLVSWPCHHLHLSSDAC